VEDSVDRHVAVWAKELAWMDPVKEAIFFGWRSWRAMPARRDGHARLRRVKQWQYKVLLMLRRLGPPYETSPSHLAELLGLTRGALSARLAPIEEAGLITRTHETGDRRRVKVRLSDAGYAVSSSMWRRRKRARSHCSQH